MQAIVALCTETYHLAKRTTQSLLPDRFAVSMSGGTLVTLAQATVQAVAEPMAEARAAVQEQPTADLHAAGGREGRARAWLWAAITTWVTVFAVRLARGARVAQALLGERFCGILVTDCWTAYTWYQLSAPLSAI